MLTKYAKNCMDILRTDAPIPNAGSNAKAVVEIIDYQGASKWCSGKPYASASTNVITGAIAQESVGIAIGSGTTAESDNFSALANKISSGFTGSCTNSVIYDSDTNVLTSRNTVTISNTGETALEINEIGFYCNFATAAKGSNVSSSPRYSCLMDRTLLSSTVTIPAGQSGVIYYDFVLNGGAVTSSAE